MTLLAVVFAPALAAILLSLLPRRAPVRWVPIVPAVIFVYLVTQVGLPDILAINIPWAPSLGVSLGLWLDGLGLLFALVITGIGALILLYASAYFHEREEFARFSTYTLLFMTAMLGVALSSNLLLVFVFWELTSFTSYLLIGFKRDKEAAREGARRALLVTGGGGLAMLGGIILIGVASGTFEIPLITAAGFELRDHAFYAPALLLILVGAFTKSAQFPFHFWLPGAMEAPTPASAYLHSATMVKAGVFLLARLSFALSGTDLWFYSLMIVGLFTFCYGALFALRQTDLKGILAYSTVSWLGALVALLAPGTTDGITAMAVGVLAHALYKGALFLTAGSVDHATGTRDIRRLGRLARVMPLTALGAAIAVLSMAGIPPLMGFVSKETLLIASIEQAASGGFRLLIVAAVLLGSTLTVAVGLRVLWDTFFGAREADTPEHPHEVSPAMWIGALSMGALSIALPLLLAQAVDPLVNAAVTAISGAQTNIHLHLFEGINTPFLLSVVAVALGVGVFLLRDRIGGWLRARPEGNPTSIYHRLFLEALADRATRLTHLVQSDRLRHHILIVALAFVFLTLPVLALSQVNLINDATLAHFDWEIAIITILLMVGAIAVIQTPTRLGAIAILGVEGALVSLTFALFGAPDVAFTQLMIEVISLVLFVLAFHFLPDPIVVRSPRSRRIRDAFVAGAFGVTMTLLVLVTGSNPIAPSISSWYVDNAESIGQGHNVVNIILVDFRGMDTQGEIAVLVIAAIGVLALLRLRPHGQPRGRYIEPDPAEQLAQDIRAAEGKEDFREGERL